MPAPIPSLPAASTECPNGRQWPAASPSCAAPHKKTWQEAGILGGGQARGLAPHVSGGDHRLGSQVCRCCGPASSSPPQHHRVLLLPSRLCMWPSRSITWRGSWRSAASFAWWRAPRWRGSWRRPRCGAHGGQVEEAFACKTQPHSKRSLLHKYSRSRLKSEAQNGRTLDVGSRACTTARAAGVRTGWCGPAWPWGSPSQPPSPP